MVVSAAKETTLSIVTPVAELLARIWLPPRIKVPVPKGPLTGAPAGPVELPRGTTKPTRSSVLPEYVFGVGSTTSSPEP
ncbi:MAG: hypothetical protein WDN28_15160 [Chthoniobacter sp.]